MLYSCYRRNKGGRKTVLLFEGLNIRCWRRKSSAAAA